MSARAMKWAADCVLPPRPKLVLTWLAYHHNDTTGQCNPSISLLMAETSLSRSALYRALAQLVEQGVIFRSTGVFGRTLRPRFNYELHFDMQVREFSPSQTRHGSAGLAALKQSRVQTAPVPATGTGVFPPSGTDQAQERQGRTGEDQEEGERLLWLKGSGEDLEVIIGATLAEMLRDDEFLGERLLEVLEAACAADPRLLDDEGVAVDALLRQEVLPGRHAIAIIEHFAYSVSK